MQIQISWLLKKPTDLDLHYLLKQGMWCSAREWLKITEKSYVEGEDVICNLLVNFYVKKVTL